MEQRVVALSGGVGGAKLALGLAELLAADELLVVANTGDDFEHLGLAISPDLDTLMYTLAGVADKKRGWGLDGETWHCMDAMRGLGGPDWFALGDRDLATHLRRSDLLRAGATLAQATAALCAALGVRHRVVPMSDDAVRTVVCTAGGELAFQEYFVRQRCAPEVRALRFEGIEHAAPNSDLLRWLADGAAVVICPSNPFLSVAPVLGLPGMREALRARTVVAVSPIVGGRALKGPTAKMMHELGLDASAYAVARHYQGLATVFVIDVQDAGVAGDIRALGMDVLVTNTVMSDLDAKRRLAAAVLGLLGRGDA